MFISVVIPTLNEEKYVGTLLQCFADQSFTDFEVIVVDCGSADKTEDVVLAFKDKLDLQFVHSPKKGVAHQRNLGAQMAKSDYVMFFDADGFIENEFMEKVVRFIEHNKGVDVLTTWIMLITDRKLDRMISITYDLLYLEVVRKVKPAAPGAFICIKKSVFDVLNGFDPEIRISEDFDLVYRSHKAGYTYELLNDPIIYTSARRIEKEGRLGYLGEMVKSGFHLHLKGAIRKDGVVEYPMEGGSYYDEPHKKNKFKPLKLNIKLPKIVEGKSSLKPILQKFLNIVLDKKDED